MEHSRQDRLQIRIIKSQVKMFGNIHLVYILKCPEFVKPYPTMNIVAVKFSNGKMVPFTEY